MMRVSRGLVPILSLTLCACGGGTRTDLPRGSAAYAIVPAESAVAPKPTPISSFDVLSVRVFGEPDLSIEDVQVGLAGTIQLPLIQEVPVAGLTASQARALIAQRLGERFIVDPQVTVTVKTSNAFNVTVEGSISDPGIYPTTGSTALLDILAQANSPTPSAKLSQVIVFRTINGQRAGAVFDLTAIRAGRSPDPVIMGGDKIVVGYDALRGAFRDFLSTTPLLNFFRSY